jgi:GlcNAc-PI de-N-acetylase
VQSFYLTPVQSFYLNRLNRRAQEMSADQLKRSAVVFSPHFDDETLGCGGTIIRKKEAGADIKIAFLADGSKSHQGFIPVEQLRTMRETEAVDAAKAMGLRAEDVFCLRFEESILIQQIDKAVARVTELLRQLQPEQVFLRKCSASLRMLAGRFCMMSPAASFSSVFSMIARFSARQGSRNDQRT